MNEQTIICMQLFAGLVVGSRRPMKRKEKMHRMVMTFLRPIGCKINSHDFPRLAPVACFPELSIDYLFFPRFLPVGYFPALRTGTGCMFSRATDRLAPVTSFFAFAASYLFFAR